MPFPHPQQRPRTWHCVDLSDERDCADSLKSLEGEIAELPRPALQITGIGIVIKRGSGGQALKQTEEKKRAEMHQSINALVTKSDDGS